MEFNFIKKIFVLLFVPVLFLPVLVYADDAMDQVCSQLTDSNSNPCQNTSPAACQAQLEKCAAYYQQESDQITQDLSKTATQKKTLSSQVAALQKKLANLKIQINQGNLMIKDLSLQIGDTSSSIDKITLQIQESKDQISSILQSIGEEDKKSSIEILLEGNLSDFFTNMVNLEGLNSHLKNLLQNTQDLKTYLEDQKNKMDDQKTKTENIVKIQTLQKQESSYTKQQQESLLNLTEAQYQQQLAQKQDTDKKVAAIKARIFDLLGISNAPTFEQAYQIAKYASGFTGVRPALILAILTQESNMGKNVGQCYLKNTSTGDGVKIKTGAFSPKTMSPARDVQSYLQIINTVNQDRGLARDPLATPVSCVMYQNGVPYGWGGAMGPSQFIASTWLKSGYGDRVQKTTGKMGDPWDIRDAFLATAFYLADAGGTTSSGEFKSVMNYFSGASWSKWEEFYGRSVLSIAAGYEDDIAAISGQ